MNEMLYASRTIGCGDRISYYLLSDTRKGLYGVAVEKLDPSGSSEKEKAFFSEDKEGAMHMLRKLMNGLVTPMTLLEILDELLE